MSNGERAAQEPAAQEPAAQEPAAQERAAQDRAAQERAAQEPSTPEPATTEQTARERAMHERAAGESAARERAARREASAHAAAVHVDAQRRAREQQERRARELVAGFVRDATARGIAPVPLAARGYGGRHRYRTGLRGWYLKPDRSIAVGTDGEFYILSVPDSALARVRGARPAPAAPPLIVGEGARDGETVSLTDLLRLRLDRPLG